MSLVEITVLVEIKVLVEITVLVTGEPGRFAAPEIVVATVVADAASGSGAVGELQPVTTRIKARPVIRRRLTGLAANRRVEQLSDPIVGPPS